MALCGGLFLSARGRAACRPERSGDAACNRLNWDIRLGHNAHAHPQKVFNGCVGAFVVDIPEDHANSSALFMVVELRYQDDGGPEGERPLTGVATLRLDVK